MNKKRIVLFAILVGILLVQYSSAASVIGDPNSTVKNSYSPGELFSGTINLSFSGISLNSILKDNFGQNFTLKNLLDSNDYNCNPSSCETSYSIISDSGKPLREYNLSKGSSVIFGLLIKKPGTFQSVDQVTLNISNNDTLSSSVPQFSIDVLNDGSTEWIAHEPSGEFGQQNKGCFSPTSYTTNGGSELSINHNFRYCERIPSMDVAPNAMIGAVVSSTGQKDITLHMTIQDANNTNSEGDCDIQVQGAGEQTISCVPKSFPSLVDDYALPRTGDYIVCISATGNGEYDGIGTIKSYSSQTPCGFSALATDMTNPDSSNYTSDYELFAQSGKFRPVRNLTLNDGALTNPSLTLEGMIHDYVNRVYKLDCSGGCVIPIKITSNEDQQMNITNVSMIINAGNQQYLPPGDPNLYNISTSVPTMSSSGYRTFSLANANFTVPESFGTQNITLSVQDGSNEYALLSREVTINKIPTVGTVDPQIAIAAIPTNFTAKINNYNSTVNITKYIWDFGDGNIQTTYTNSVAHTYNSLGWFNGNVTIVNPAGNSTTSFKVNVQTPQDAVNQLLGKKLANFDAISTKLSGMPEFAQTAVKSAINFDNLSKALNDLKAANGTASSPEVYVAIMKSLLALNVPDSLSQTSVANSVIFIQNQSNIDLDALREIGGGNYDSSQSKYYLDYISLWAIKNTTMIVNYEEYSATYGDYVEPLTDIVDLHIGSKPSRSGYVIIPKLKGITFNQQPQKEGDFYYVPLAGDSLDVQFSTSQQLNPTALPMFVAPSLSSIPVPEGGITKKTSYKFLILIFILMGIALIGGTAYIVLGKWYQKRYESYLFKNKNDLYNIVTYIHTAKIKGVKDRDIERNLRRSEWNSEQIGYVMKKYAGKGIGLPGFIKRNRQMKKDIQMKAMKSANKNRFTPNNPNIGKRMPPKG